MIETWWLFAFLSSVFNAMYVYSSQEYKMPASLFMVYRGLGAGILLLPFIPFFQPIHNPYFYLFVVLQGLLCAYYDNRFFNAVNRFGAELTSAIQPLSIGVTFVFWLLIEPQQFVILAHKPFQSLGIICCLIGITVSVLQLRKCNMGVQACVYLLPCLFMVTLSDILNKQSMQSGAENLHSAVFYYILIMSTIMGVANLWVYSKHYKISVIWQKSNLLKGFIMVLLALICLAAKNVAMFQASNPSYVAAIIYTYPMLIIGWDIWYICSRKKFLYPRISIKTVSLLLLSVIGLILLGR